MPLSRFGCRWLVLLLLVVVAGAGFLAPPVEAAKRPFADIVDDAARRHGVRAIARRRPGPDAVDAGHATRPRRLRRLRPPAKRRRRRRLPAPPHRRVRDRSRAGRLQRPGPAPCGATTASRPTKRRTPTCGPCSAAAGPRLAYRNPRNRSRPETGRTPGPRRTMLKALPLNYGCSRSPSRAGIDGRLRAVAGPDGGEVPAASRPTRSLVTTGRRHHYRQR